jgi:hypothetical protein
MSNCEHLQSYGHHTLCNATSLLGAIQQRLPTEIDPDTALYILKSLADLEENIGVVKHDIFARLREYKKNLPMKKGWRLADENLARLIAQEQEKMGKKLEEKANDGTN